jgi:cytochrome c
MLPGQSPGPGVSFAMRETMSRSLALSFAAAAMTLSGTALFAGDPEAGAAAWRECRSCHMITSPTGETIQRGGRVGPNLYGIAGAPIGSVDGFRYSAELAALGASGMVWTAELFAAYVADATAFVREHSGNSGARSPMNYQMRAGAADMYAYLESLTQ